MSISDLTVVFPAPGVIRLRSRDLFGNPDDPICRRFLERVFRVEEITDVTLTGGESPQAELRFCPRLDALEAIVKKVASFLLPEPEPRPARAGLPPRPTSAAVTQVASAASARDSRDRVRLYRHDTIVTGWQIRAERPGYLKLRNPVLFRKKALCNAIERELTGVLGIDRFSANSITCTVRVDYDPAQLTKAQVIEILDAAARSTLPPQTPDGPWISSTSICPSARPRSPSRPTLSSPHPHSCRWPRRSTRIPRLP